MIRIIENEVIIRKDYNGSTTNMVNFGRLISGLQISIKEWME